jgi:dihydroorotase
MAGAVLILLAIAPSYDLVLRGGRVLDARNGIDRVMDVAISEGSIAAVAPSIDSTDAGLVVDARGLLVAPGLIDLHTHLFFGTEENADYSNGFNSLPPDGFTFRSCVTTAVDTGGSGWRNFPQFKQQVIDRAGTRVLALLNIAGSGMKGGPVEQNLGDMDPKLTAQRALEFPGTIVGIKVAHYRGPEWDPVDRAVQAGSLAGLPVMVDFGGHEPPLSLEALLLTHLRPGDILTHTYAEVEGRVPIVDEAGRLRPFLRQARERDIVFDVGHGAGSFVFRQARPAMEQEFAPDTISTDLHRASMNGGMKDMLNVMSKFLSLGMTIEDAVRAATSSAARAIRRDDLGHLAVGAGADVAVLSVREGRFGFVDVGGIRHEGNRKLECELAIRAGKVVWDLNGIAIAQGR